MSDHKYNTNNPIKKEKENVDVMYTPSMFIRLLNYIIDTISIVIIALLIGKIIGIDYNKYVNENYINNNFNNIQYLVLAISFLYYSIFEAIFGKTLGKVITKTKVVDVYGDKTTLSKILLRSIVRLIPFAPIVIFFTNNHRTLHDILSKTYVVVDE